MALKKSHKTAIYIGVAVIVAGGISLLIFREKIFGTGKTEEKKEEAPPSESGGDEKLPPKQSDEDKKRQAEWFADLLSGRKQPPKGKQMMSKSNMKMVMETRLGYKYDETTKQAVKIV